MEKETVTMTITRDLFDEMLEHVATKERERIIKLLEDSMAICAKNQHEDGCDACYGQRDAIALIKEENK